MRESKRSFDSCNSCNLLCKRLVPSRLHQLNESKLPFVSRIRIIRSKLSVFPLMYPGSEREGGAGCAGAAVPSAPGVCPVRGGHRAGGAARRLAVCTQGRGQLSRRLQLTCRRREEVTVRFVAHHYKLGQFHIIVYLNGLLALPYIPDIAGGVPDWRQTPRSSAEYSRGIPHGHQGTQQVEPLGHHGHTPGQKSLDHQGHQNSGAITLSAGTRIGTAESNSSRKND